MDEKCFGLVLHPLYLESLRGFLKPYLRQGPGGTYILGRKLDSHVGSFVRIDAQSDSGEFVTLFLPSRDVSLVASIPHDGSIGFGSNAPSSAAVTGGACE